jgi:hypothetical protein
MAPPSSFCLDHLNYTLIPTQLCNWYMVALLARVRWKGLELSMWGVGGLGYSERIRTSQRMIGLVYALLPQCHTTVTKYCKRERVRARGLMNGQILKRSSV